jgi:mannose-1-phosphate guanylyltransferase/phosphomannomutase
MMTAATQADMLMVCDGAGSFIFPDFLPAVDGLMATVRFLEYLAMRALPVSEIVRYLPPIHTAKDSVHCPWEAKGSIMRQLHEAYKTSQVENVDGIKVHMPDGAWVHLSPHPDKPVIDIVGEAGSKRQATELVQQTVEQVERILQNGG